MKELNLFFFVLFFLMSLSVIAIPEKNMANEPEARIAKLEAMLEQFERSNLENEKGSKLKLGERFVASIIRKKIKKKIKRIEKGKDDGLAIASLSLGVGAVILALLGFLASGLWFVAGVFVLAGFTLGLIAKSQNNSPLAKGAFALNTVLLVGALVAGLVIGLIFIAWLSVF